MTKIYADNLTKSETGNTVTRASMWTAEDGTVFFDVRKFYKNKGSDEFKPGKGLSLPMDVNVLDALIEAATAAKKDAAALAKKSKKTSTDKKPVADKKTSTDKKPVADKKTSTDKKPVADKKTSTKIPSSITRVRVGVKK